MLNAEIQELARLLIERVRDIDKKCDQASNQDSNDPVAKGWCQTARVQNDLRVIGRVLIADVVDEIIFNLLDAIDEGHLSLTFTASSGKQIGLEKEGQGELAGYYMGSGGWPAMHSKERLSDDFSDLR